MVDWSVYLRSICDCKKYACWWDVYTLTDVVGQKRAVTEASPPLGDFGLKVQTVGLEKPEQLDVLEGLRKYAKDHLLLIGKPGSGKSTALIRLLLEEAQKAQQETQAIIPVLVELRYYQTSVMDLIRDFLKRHRVLIQSSEIETLLFEGKLLLLIDGVNELPSEEARRNLKAFEQNHPATSMAFTTRELQVGGDLSITKKLEMQALTEPQMREFVKKYLPGKSEQLLRQLGTRLREFGQTPLLLWMLCSVFRDLGKVPPNLGLVFRSFSESYENKIQQDVPAKDESREWWHRLLRHLAFTMMQGKERTELQVAIPKEEAKTTLTRFLQNEGYHQPHNALSWLDDLVKYHLIQIANNQIEFRHQLIQEYYAAENLLDLLPKLSDEELKWEYLNYLKWTEPLALMLALVDSQEQAVRLVKLAIEIDWQLGSRLAGAAKIEFHKATVSLVTKLDVPLLVKTQLWSLTRSEEAVPKLTKALKDEDSPVRMRAADALGEIGSEAAVSALITALKHEDSSVRMRVADALGGIGSEAAVSALITALKDEDSSVRMRVADALGEIGSEAAVSALITALKDEDSSVRMRVADALGEIGSEVAVSALITALKHEDSSMRVVAVDALGKIGSEAAVSALITALKDEDSSVRMRVADALGEIGSEAAVSTLITALEDQDSSVRMRVADALGEIGSEAAVSTLITALEDQDSSVRMRVADALGEIGSEAAVSALITALEDQDSSVRWMAAYALGKTGSEAAVSALITALKHEDLSVRRIAAYALGKIGSEAAVSPLITVLEDQDLSVRMNAAEALGKIGSEAAVSALITALKHEESFVRGMAAYALGEIGSEAAVSALITALKDQDSSVRVMAADALGKIGSEAAVSALITALKDEDSSMRVVAADALGEIGSEAAVSALITALKHEDLSVRRIAADALGKIGSEAAVSPLITALKDEDSDVRRIAAEALGKIAKIQLIPQLKEILFTFPDFHLLNAIATIQERHKYYQEIPHTTVNPLPITHISSISMHILHLSDLHFGTPYQANLWSGQLAEDLHQELGISHLDALILSGDIANKSTPEEYAAAKLFLDEFRQDFPLNPTQIVIVPGNHDLNWTICEEDAYKPVLRKKYKGPIDENHVIDDGSQYLAVLDEQEYLRRFEYFSDFYQAIKEKNYPLEYQQQYTLETIGNLLILGLNSAWQLDHHYKNRASINNDAFSNALKEISRNEAYKNCSLKMAVWHHPLNSAYEDRIKDSNFLGRLAVNEFQLFLHGHVHKADNDRFYYDSVEDGRKLHRICAGTFGAQIKELETATPWQYNLLILEGEKITVRTRKRESESGAWESDARWRQGAGKSSLDYYTINLPPKLEAV